MFKNHNYTNTPEKEHDSEHDYWSRRSFMKALGFLGSGSMLLNSKILSASTNTALSNSIANAENDNILILIRLVGGNDGLNTIVPLNQYDLYANARPTLKIPENKIIKLSDEFGIPNYMGDLKELWDEGQFKAVQGVGSSATQSLSHFTRAEVWSNADIETSRFFGEETGWMGRYLEDLNPNYLLDPPKDPAGIQIGNYGDIILQGEEVNYGFTATNISELEIVARSGLKYEINPELFKDCTYSDQLKFLRGVANTTYEYSGVINEAYNKGKNDVEYDTNETSRQLALIARLIKGKLGTKVFMISLGGFDTHAGQANQHQRLMVELSNSVKNFYKDLAFTGDDKRTLGITYSEFGRRITENGSRGTDHGKAAPMLLFGKGLNGSGFAGKHPSLKSDDDNLKYNTDFRDVYATILAEWLCVPIPTVEKLLLGHKYNPINLGLSCNGETSTDNPSPITPENLSNNLVRQKVYYNNNSSPTIRVEMPNSSRVKLQLFTLLGQKKADIYNEFVFEKEFEINVGEIINGKLATGTYIYQLQVGDRMFSNKILIKNY